MTSFESNRDELNPKVSNYGKSMKRAILPAATHEFAVISLFGEARRWGVDR
jgi:hypothetical protein